MPRRPTPTLRMAPLLAKVMWLHHVTDMYNLYTPMYFHHIAASCIMMVGVVKPAILCVVCIVSFFIHVLPIIYHQIPNVFWLLTSSLALVYFMSTDRIMPRRRISTFKNTPIWAKGMWLHHVTHTVFYIVEIYVTDMYNLYTPMYIHHIAASCLMMLSMIEPGILSAVYVIPFCFHGVFWARGASELDILTIYNYSLVIASILILYDSAKTRVITPIVPAMGIALSCVNAYIYCCYYQGTYCPASILPSDRQTELIIGLVFWFCFLVMVCTYIGIKHRKASLEMQQHGYEPSVHITKMWRLDAPSSNRLRRDTMGNIFADHQSRPHSE
ncbi:hypothetical protein SmJEL517_g05908 [Synchytrium microbalum]|uniref:TLC domain-containing protein n=1 Tax=Synchytrium microbalum TaxID=1806994 RepID=A0A507BU36_9FUNG|nr:uncharacterized protein SmJEL517_g05908 [Synchytrium microbalum]TPX30559.1 hypothetical protein SmJEL517_g05908 [Synchytrium microbalum]